MKGVSSGRSAIVPDEMPNGRQQDADHSGTDTQDRKEDERDGGDKANGSGGKAFSVDAGKAANAGEADQPKADDGSGERNSEHG